MSDFAATSGLVSGRVSEQSEDQGTPRTPYLIPRSPIYTPDGKSRRVERTVGSKRKAEREEDKYPSKVRRDTTSLYRGHLST